MTVQSEFGRGSNFVLTVPTGDLQGVTILQSPDQATTELAEKAVPSTAKSLQGVRVLLAEDGFDNRQLIGIMLRNAGAEVEIAEDGRQAVDKAQAGSFDLILMDINMPVMDGYEATRLLRSQGYERPILALTANAMAEDTARCLQAGCNDHLTKPIDRLRLIRAVGCYAGASIGAGVSTPAAGEESALAGQGMMVSEFLDDPDISPILFSAPLFSPGSYKETAAKETLSSRQAWPIPPASHPGHVYENRCTRPPRLHGLPLPDI